MDLTGDGKPLRPAKTGVNINASFQGSSISDARHPLRAPAKLACARPRRAKRSNPGGCRSHALDCQAALASSPLFPLLFMLWLLIDAGFADRGMKRDGAGLGYAQGAKAMHVLAGIVAANGGAGR